METDVLGRWLRHRRTAAGLTIAAVATDAGLSVPYIANLENGRGNPTLSTVNRLIHALGAHLVIELTDDNHQARETISTSPDGLEELCRLPRLAIEIKHLAKANHTSEAVARERLLHVIRGMSQLIGRPVDEIGLHRILDAAILATRS